MFITWKSTTLFLQLTFSTVGGVGIDTVSTDAGGIIMKKKNKKITKIILPLNMGKKLQGYHFLYL